MSNVELQSKTISFLRFPLMMAVVLIHSRVDEVNVNGVDLVGGSFPVYEIVADFISDVLARVAVPLFFFFSGFLFFSKTEFSFSLYIEKIKKRTRTLLVPYLFWNALVIGLLFVLQVFSPSLLSGENKMIADYTVKDWLEAFWARPFPEDNPSYRPIAYQFWFLRDLMVVMLLSPMVYFLVRYLRYFGMLILAGLWMAGV